jgi:D-alanyl-D-alanine carboxypeptidase (penicillin-binding protein 5/6)
MGLNVTRFVEASGISEFNMTTAAEFAWFCRQYIRQHPNSMRDFHSVQQFSYPVAANVPERLRNNPHTITQNSNNSLLWTFPGIDGLKTGFINQSGFNIALTGERGNTRFIAVLLGASSARNRSLDGTELFAWAFDNFKTVRPVIGRIENVRLWKGRANSAELMLAASPDFTSPTNRSFSLSYETFIPAPLTAPLPAGSIAGFLIISDEHGELNRVPLVTTRSYERGNIFKRIWHSILLLFRR